MTKKIQKDPLNGYQREALTQAHGVELMLEVTLVTLFVAFYTLNVSSAIPGYGVFVVILIFLASLLLFIGGIIVTSMVFRSKRLGKPLASKFKGARRWAIATWVSVPVALLLFIFNNPFKDGEFSLASLILVLAVALFTVISIIGVCVSIHSVWRRFNKKRISPRRLITYGALGLGLFLLTLLGSYTTKETVEYSSTPITDSNLELGQTEVRQVGKNGEKEITHNLIFGFETSSTGSDAVDEIIANGSRRYQYMYCSDGSHRYYTAEQFKDPNVGFTHQSPDYCARNGAGTQTTIADVPPAEKIIQQVPTYSTYRPSSYTTTCNTYTYSSSITCRTY